MSREYIKDAIGATLGYTEKEGERIYAYNKIGARVGYYDIQLNRTYSQNGSLVGAGNQLCRLI